MKVGLLGGSFDPIHFGHLNMAINLLEMCGLDQILFCPTALSPFKIDTPAKASISDRIEMLKRAISAVPSFKILDWEAQEERPFYTIDTVRKLLKDPSLHLHLLIGEDHLEPFSRWKEMEKLIQLAPPIVASRTISSPTQQLFPSDIQRVKIPLYDISSTSIRKRLSQGLYCGHLLPEAVLEYIFDHELYKF